MKKVFVSFLASLAVMGAPLAFACEKGSCEKNHCPGKKGATCESEHCSCGEKCEKGALNKKLSADQEKAHKNAPSEKTAP